MEQYKHLVEVEMTGVEMALLFQEMPLVPDQIDKFLFTKNKRGK